MSLAGSQMQTIHNSFIHISPVAFLSDSLLFPWKLEKKKKKAAISDFPLRDFVSNSEPDCVYKKLRKK